jgi:hypothetical protein
MQIRSFSQQYVIIQKLTQDMQQTPQRETHVVRNGIQSGKHLVKQKKIRICEA